MVSAATDRVREALAVYGVPCEVMEFPQGTRSATDAARAIGTTLGQIVKSLVFLADGKPILVLASGRNRVDTGKLSRVSRASRIERADADRVRAETGFAVGGVPPVGHTTALPTFVDVDLLAYETVYAAAGTPTAIFPIAPSALVQVTAGRTVDLAESQ